MRVKKEKEGAALLQECKEATKKAYIKPQQLHIAQLFTRQKGAVLGLNLILHRSVQGSEIASPNVEKQIEDLASCQIEDQRQK